MGHGEIARGVGGAVSRRGIELGGTEFHGDRGVGCGVAKLRARGIGGEAQRRLASLQHVEKIAHQPVAYIQPPAVRVQLIVYMQGCRTIP